MTTSDQIVRKAPPPNGAAPRTDDAPNGSRPTPPLTVIVKRRVLGASSRLGLLSNVRDSAWRQRRLLILCYHSISIDDEHEWSGTYSMAPAVCSEKRGSAYSSNFMGRFSTPALRARSAMCWKSSRASLRLL